MGDRDPGSTGRLSAGVIRGRVGSPHTPQKGSMKKRTTHRETLQQGLARPLLNVPVPDQSISVYQRLVVARVELDEAVALANRELRDNPLAEILAEHAMRQGGRRGFPLIVVDPDGTPMLEIHYEDQIKEETPEAVKTKRKSLLPSITALRAEATQLGLDPLLFGKNKTKLLQAMEATRKRGNKSPPPAPVVTVIPDPPAPVAIPEPPTPVATVIPDPPAPLVPASEPVKPKMFRTAPALSPVTVVQPDTASLIHDEEDDLSSLFGAGHQPPAPAKSVAVPKKGTATSSTGPAKKIAGRSLSDLVSKAGDEVDINAILSKGAPKQLPPED